MKKSALIIIALFVFFFNVTPVLAGAFQLTKIGSMDTNGALFDTWYYTGTQPTFSGIGLAGEQVTIVLDGESFNTSVDSENNWRWTPEASLSSEQHYISFASAGSSIGFNLFAGEDIPDGISAPEATSTPVAGSAAATLVFSSLGTSLVGASYLLYKKRSHSQ
jgi:hypothetical protein